MAAAYDPLHLGNNLLRRVGAKSDARLRVLAYHDVAPQEQERFTAQLRWLAQSWTFVSPQRFAAMMQGDEPIKGANLLLTFDDGFASNRVVVEEVLNPMGIRALFFVVSDLVALVDRDEARHFIAKHIRPGSHADDLPAHLYNVSGKPGASPRRSRWAGHDADRHEDARPVQIGRHGDAGVGGSAGITLAGVASARAAGPRSP